MKDNKIRLLAVILGLTTMLVLIISMHKRIQNTEEMIKKASREIEKAKQEKAAAKELSNEELFLKNYDDQRDIVGVVFEGGAHIGVPEPSDLPDDIETVYKKYQEDRDLDQARLSIDKICRTKYKKLSVSVQQSKFKYFVEPLAKITKKEDVYVSYFKFHISNKTLSVEEYIMIYINPVFLKGEREKIKADRLEHALRELYNYTHGNMQKDEADRMYKKYELQFKEKLAKGRHK